MSLVPGGIDVRIGDVRIGDVTQRFRSDLVPWKRGAASAFAGMLP